MRIHTATCDRNFGHILRFFSFVLLHIELGSASEAPGVHQLHKSLGQLTLSSSAFSASSVYENQDEFKAHKANFAVFSSQVESFGAWCPSKPVQNRQDEWLQVDFGSMKIMRILFTEGHRNKQNAYVPSFVLRYQRQEGGQWYEYRMRNGSKLLHTNRDGQTIATKLNPPIVAMRFRLYPYNDLEPLFMCLRLAIYGSEFEDGVVEYVIPEGNMYRGSLALNDTTYDGFWTKNDSPSLQLSTNDNAERAYLYGGMGLLMDKQYYEGDLPESADNHNVIGWFRGPHSTVSDRLSMLFVFDEVRNFTQVQFHALRFSEHQGLFDQVLIQFSNGGDYFDRQSKPILMSMTNSLTSDMQARARWISVNLRHRVGRFMRLSLWFDSDWIILSEITFNSTPIDQSTDQVRLEQPSDPSYRLENVDTPVLELKLPNANGQLAAISRIDHESGNVPITVPSVLSIKNANNFESGITNGGQDGGLANLNNRNALKTTTSKYRQSSTPYIVAILCCFIGSLAFVSLLAFMVCRLRQTHLRRMKKRQKCVQPVADSSRPNQNNLFQHPLLLTNSQHQQPSQQKVQKHVLPSDTPASLNVNSNNVVGGGNCLLSDSTISSVLLPNSIQYNQLSNGHPLPAFAPAYPNLTLSSLAAQQQLNSLPLLNQFADSLCPSPYSQYTPGVDQESLFRLLQHGSSIPTQFPLTGLTITRPELLDSLNVPHHLTLGSPVNGMVNAALSSATGTIFPTAQFSAQVQFRPPPPPDQPLPPLPPPSSSPDLTSQIADHIHGGGGGMHNNTLSPYTAAAHSFPTDTGFLLPLDGSMPEYASASLFSGTGSNHPGLGGSNNSSATELDPSIRQRFVPTDTAYHVPHLNAIQSHWFHPPSNLNPGGVDFAINPSAAQPIPCDNDQLSSVDSSGMYYLTNRADKLPFLNLTHLTSTTADPTQPSQTILLPFQGLPLLQGYQIVNSQQQTCQSDSGIGNCNTLSLNDSTIPLLNGNSDFDAPLTPDMNTTRLPLPQKIHAIHDTNSVQADVMHRT